MSGMVALRAHSLLTNSDTRPSVILVHGAANSARVWTFWQGELARRGWSSHAIDLRGHGASAPAELDTTRMADYADDVVALARALREPPVAPRVEHGRPGGADGGRRVSRSRLRGA